MSLRIKELLSTIPILISIWLSAFIGDFIAIRTYQMNGQSIHNPGWSVFAASAIQLILMYAGVKIVLKILTKERVKKSTEILAILFGWLFSGKILAFPKLLSIMFPTILISTNIITPTITVIIVHLVATYVLVLIISRLILQRDVKESS